MTRIAVLLAAVLAVHAATATAAQLYRWVDDKGRVEWRDTPPPANAKKVERRTVGGSVIETSTLPYSVQQAVRNFPVTLYTTDCGQNCKDARAHLIRRGIPYTEKNPQNDLESYKKMTNGVPQVPLLVVGSDSLQGYSRDLWDRALDSVGYPREPAPGYAPPSIPARAPAPAPAPTGQAPSTPAQ